MRRLFIVFLVFSFIGFSNCTEDEILSSSSELNGFTSESFEVLNPKEPLLHTVIADGSTVTLQFTNHASPNQPEGGYELMLNGNRTRENIIPRVHSDKKNLSMTFNLSNPENYTFQIYARWWSGFLRSNKLGANESLGGGETTEPTNTPDDGDSGHSDVNPAADLKEPVISDLSINGSEVTLKFVNFSAPDQPEGGYELMVDGQRTRENFVPRLYSGEKYLTLKFNISNPESKYYQVYARWNSGYLRSAKFYPDQNTDDGNQEPTDDTPSYDGSVVNFRALKTWNFNESTPESEGGVKFWGLEDGKIISASGASDGKAARFYVDTKDRSHNRMELVMTEEMSPIMAQYFSSDRGLAHAEMGKELVYQFRIKLSENWQKDTKFFDGDGYTSLFEFKQDYFSSRDPIKRIRDATFRLRISKDTYNFVFRATPESFENATRDSDGNIVQKGKAQVENLSASSDFGKWRLWTVYAKWSSGSDGFIRIFRDDQLVYSRENKYTAYDDEPWLGPYMKFGLYDPWFKFGNDTGSDYKETYVDYVKVGVPE